MKITGVHIYRTKIPLKKSYEMSTVVGAVNNTEPIIVKLDTDDGFFGYGETDLIHGFQEDTLNTVVRDIEDKIGPAIIGIDPTNIAKVHEIMDGVVKGHSFSKSAIDIACYDILGKSLDVPVYKLLGGNVRDSIQVMWALGTDSPEANAREAAELKELGYSTIMIKVGALDIAKDAERVQAVRSAVGGRYPLIVDANQGWDADTAIEFWKLVKNQNIALLEQPVHAKDIDGLARVRKHIDIPVSADESILSVEDAVKLAKSEAVDVFSIKVAKHGGIYRTKEIVTVAASFGIDCLMNSMLEEGITQAASLQVGVTLANLAGLGHAYFSPLRLDDDVTTYSQQLKDGVVSVTDKPGLGIDIREDVLSGYTTSVTHVD